MQSSIYKYPLAVTDHQLLELPAHSRIMTVQVQLEKLYAWVWVLLPEPGKAESPDTWEVFVIGTGHNADLILEQEPLSYMGTVQMKGGALVWHVFVRPLRKSP